VKNYKKLTIQSQINSEYYKESRGKGGVSINDKFIWQSMVVNDLSDYNLYKILCCIGFVERYEPSIFDKTIYNNEDVVIINIVDGIFGL